MKLESLNSFFRHIICIFREQDDKVEKQTRVWRGFKHFFTISNLDNLFLQKLFKLQTLLSI